MISASVNRLARDGSAFPVGVYFMARCLSGADDAATYDAVAAFTFGPDDEKQ
jgi:hypothetical protein